MEQGLLEDEARAGNTAWLTSVRLGRPYVRWKYAATLAAGSRRPTPPAAGSARPSPAPTSKVHAEADAVIVGSGTLRAAPKHLAVRGVAGATQPLRVVVDTDATAVKPGARVLDDAAPTLIAVAEDAGAAHLAETGADVVRLPRAATGLDIHALLAALHARGVRSVLLEGGPTLAGAFVAAGAVDTVTGYLAPVLLGAGPAALATPESPP